MFYNHPEGIRNPEAGPITMAQMALLGMQIDNHNWHAVHPSDFDQSTELDPAEMDGFMGLVENIEQGAAWQALLHRESDS